MAIIESPPNVSRGKKYKSMASERHPYSFSIYFATGAAWNGTLETVQMPLLEGSASFASGPCTWRRSLVPNLLQSKGNWEP